MKKICSILLCLTVIFSSVSGFAAKDYSNYTAVEGVGHLVTFDGEYSSALAINGSTDITDISNCPVSPGRSGAEGNVLKLSLSGSYSSAPYVASGDSGNGMLSYSQSKDMVVRISMDAAFSDPSLVWSFFQTKGWSSDVANTWMNGYAQMQVSGGKLVAAGTKLDSITVEPDVFHNYMIILDVPSKMAYFYFDESLVHQKSLEGSGMLGFARWAANFPKSYSEDTYVYFDNITLQTLTNSFKAELVSKDDLNACSYESPDIRLKFSDTIDEDSLLSITLKDIVGNVVTHDWEYDKNNREYTFTNLTLNPATKYIVDISGVRGSNSEIPSGTTSLEFATAFSKGPDIEKLGAVIGAGHYVNFDSDYSDSIVTSGSVKVDNIGGLHGSILSYSLSGDYDAAPYIASSDKGNGILTFKQSSDKIAVVSMDMMLSDTMPTWTFFQTKGWSSATSNTWMNGYAQMQVSGGKLIAAGDVVSGVEIKPDIFYNYMMIADVPGQMVYFYLDGKCIHQKSLVGSGMLGFARWASSFPKSYSKETYAYFDNVKLRVLSEGYTAVLGGFNNANEVDYEKEKSFYIEFSDEMNVASLDKITIVSSDGGKVIFDGNYDADERKYTVSGISLKPSVTYTVDMSEVCNSDGVGMTGTSQCLVFTTQKTPIHALSAEINGDKLNVTLGNRTEKGIGVILIASYYNEDKFVSCSSTVYEAMPGQYDMTINKKSGEYNKIVLYIVYRDNLNFIEKHILN